MTAAAAAAFFFRRACYNQQAMAEVKRDMLIRADRILGGLDAGDDQYIVTVRNGRFADFTPASRFDFSGRHAVELRVPALAPLYCDYHIHLQGSRKLPPEKVARELLRYGIGFVYEGGSPSIPGGRLRKTVHRLVGLKTAGAGLAKEGGYGRLIGTMVSSLREARYAIDRLADKGVDYLKVVHSGIYAPESDSITAGGFTRGELRTVVRYARRFGLPVFCHVNGRMKTAEAVECGASAIVHGLGVSGTTLRQMAQEGTAFIPTVHAFESLFGLRLSRTGRRHLALRLRKHRDAVRYAFQAGVTVLPGSDSGSSLIPHGASYVRELECFLEAGVPESLIFHSAALRPLRPGMTADFLVPEGFRPAMVYLGGSCVHKS